MNIEIKEKFNNFVKIIENKEKMEWLKQINIHNKKNQSFQEIQEQMSSNKNDYKNNCSCPISSGYDSESESKLASESKKISNNINLCNNNKLKSSSMSKSKSESKSNSNKSSNKLNSINSIKTKNSSSNKYDELSLLEDDYFIGIEKHLKTSNNNFLDDNQNSVTNNLTINKLTTKTIGSEFQNIFLINDNLTKINKIKKNESSEIKNNLENIYNKIIIKNPAQNKSHGYKISEYLNLNKLETKKTIDDGIKKISELVEFVYKESTRGWNYEHNIYILQVDKLKENFEKVIFSDNISEPCKNLIKIGFIYRNFNEPKVYLDNDFTKHWVSFDINSNNSKKMVQTKHQIKDKILFYCLKNLTKSNKFKKKISKITYKFIKKTVQIYGNKDLIVDIILFVGIENIETIG